MSGSTAKVIDLNPSIFPQAIAILAAQERKVLVLWDDGTETLEDRVHWPCQTINDRRANQ